ncbi:MAG: DUF3267 domain-containing protein [Lysinibacillus sp.]
MHCIKTINIERDFGSTRFFLMASIVFFVVFCLAYISTSYQYTTLHQSDYLVLFLFSLLLLYPLHKFTHILLFILYRLPMQLKLQRKFFIMPVIHVRILEIVSKKLYTSALLLPFISLNSVFLYAAFAFPAYAHYFCLLLALHCSICFVDLLFWKEISFAPKNAFIEETPRGYEILVPDA